MKVIERSKYDFFCPNVHLLHRKWPLKVESKKAFYYSIFNYIRTYSIKSEGITLQNGDIYGVRIIHSDQF